jgi:hypothetical protein
MKKNIQELSLPNAASKHAQEILISKFIKQNSKY